MKPTNYRIDVYHNAIEGAEYHATVLDVETGRRSEALHYLHADEVAALLEAASSSGRTGIRNAAAIALMYFTGLRVSEVCHLRCRCVDVARRRSPCRPRARRAGASSASRTVRCPTSCPGSR